MPNIEIHGFGAPHNMSTTTFAKLLSLQTEIVEILQEYPFAGDAVINSCSSFCAYFDGRPAPFLRICDTDPERAKTIAEALKPLNIDIEIIHLLAFYPAEPA